MKIKAKSIFTVIMITMILFVLAACTGLTPGSTGEEKAVPVYQGMVVSETLSTLSADDSISSNIMRLSNNGVTRNLNTNPIDQDDPFGTLDVGTISDVITTEFPVVQTEVSDYYSEIYKDIFITVKLSNPDNFVILSFTLNGVFYQSYQFQEGSDSENLILKVNTGTLNGVKEYTIDAIKYIDGTEIKDAIFAGDRTITVGLKHSSEPSVQISNEVVNATSILLTVNLSDSQSLSTLNKIVLYDGESLVQIYDLEIGENNIVFDKLNINTLYQYAVISIYDLIDGNNSRLSILGKKALYTDDILAINNVVPTQTNIGFGITVTDVDQVGAISAIELYQGETLVEALTDLSVREFTGLLSNNEYTIKVTYTYDLNDGNGEQESSYKVDVMTNAKYIEIQNIMISNEEAIYSDSDVFISIDFINPDKVIIDAVMINDKWITVLGDNVTETTWIRIKPDTLGGTYEIVISGVKYQQKNNVFVQILDIPVVEEIYVVGNLWVNKVYSSNGVLAMDEENYIYIEFGNLELYELTQLQFGNKTFTGSDFIFVDLNTVKVLWNLDGHSDFINIYEVQLHSVEYRYNDEINVIYMDGEDYEDWISYQIVLKTNEVRSIETIQDLKNIELGYRYELLNDLDLSGIMWTPINFTGFFDGNGYTINNLTSTSGGLFEQFSGRASNLNVTNFSIIIEGDGMHHSYLGGFSVYGNAHIDNLFLQGGIRVKDVTSIQVFQVGGVTAYGLQSIQNSIIDVDITAINFLGTIKIGGIAVSGDTQISSTTYSGNIVVDSSDSNIIVAGFVSDADHTITENSVMSGSISVINANQVIAGGFYGFSNRQYAVDYYLNEIKTSRMNGEINVTSSSAHVGGFMGFQNSSRDSLLIENSLLAGQITVNSSVGNVDAFTSNEVLANIINSFIAFDVSINENGTLVEISEIATSTQLNSKIFYLDNLKWSETFWDFSDLDYNNSVYPSIKRTEINID